MCLSFFRSIMWFCSVLLKSLCCQALIEKDNKKNRTCIYNSSTTFFVFCLKRKKLFWSFARKLKMPKQKCMGKPIRSSKKIFISFSIKVLFFEMRSRTFYVKFDINFRFLQLKLIFFEKKIKSIFLSSFKCTIKVLHFTVDFINYSLHFKICWSRNFFESTSRWSI